jgi:hypothetical protein
MPTTLPVPSKGSLRALRNLALGTSCTLALSAGLLTEDRRRRIHAAREVHDNAKKLKSSRKYHSAGMTAIDTFEGQLLRHQEDTFWLPSNVAKSSAPRVIRGGVETEGPEDKNRSRPSTTRSTPQRSSRYKIQPSKLIFRQPTKTENSNQPLDSTIPDPSKIPKQKLHNRQHKLAADVTKLLEQPENIDEAASRFFEAFEEGLSIDGFGILQPLIDAAIGLANACEAQSKFESLERVFDIILGLGTLHEEQFHSFHPEVIIKRLLSRHDSDYNLLDPEKLRKASSIFLTKFKEEPKTMSIPLQHIGNRLCAETCRFRMYDLTLDIYSRIQSCRGDSPLVGVDHLITATHMKGQHTKVFRYFHTFYTRTAPNQLEFFNIGSLTIDSILKTRRIDRAEQALAAAAQMAEKNGILTSTTWHLKVLGYEWRSHRDLERTRALFQRLEPLLHVTQHPQAFYGAMVQFCIEANDEPLARSYFDTMRQLYPPLPGDVRIYGHFAFAKAMRKDWIGVEDDFCKMKQANPEQYDEEFSASFAPILKLYTQSHSVSDTEEFIRIFLFKLGIKLTYPLMNIMVDAYGDAKEIDSLARWINYATAAGCPVNSVTFNTILNKCSQTWGFSFWEVFLFYQSVLRLGPGHSRFIDEDTVPILRRIAISGSPPQEELTRRLSVLKNMVNKSAHGLSSKEVLRAMEATLANENPVATLKIYKRAQADQVILDSKHLNLAIKASLQLHENHVEETLRHIQDAQSRDIDVSPAIAQIIVHQMSTMYEGGNTETRQFTELAQSTISALEKRGMAVPARMLTHVTSILERQGHYRLCIDVWDSMSSHLGLRPSSIDLITLTVLLKAYIGLWDHIGVQWVVKTLAANMLYPDARFRLLLKNARRKTSKLLGSGNYPDAKQKFLNALVEAIEVTRLLREEAVDLKQDVKSKTFKIIEQAIADEAARECLGPSSVLEVGENLKEAVMETSSKDSSVELREAWLAGKEEEHVHVDMEIPPQGLVGVSAG